MDVYVYAAGAAPGAAVLAQGTLTRQLANAVEVTFPAPPGLAIPTNYVLAIGAPLQNTDQRVNGYPTPGQLQNISAAGVHTFIV